MDTSEFVTTLILAILGSSLISTIVTAVIGRRREEAEVENLADQGRKTAAEADTLTAQAYTFWMEANIELQQQRQRDLEYYEKKLDDLETLYEQKLAEAELKRIEDVQRAKSELMAELKLLRDRVRTLEQDLMNERLESMKKDQLIQQLKENRTNG